MRARTAGPLLDAARNSPRRSRRKRRILSSMGRDDNAPVGREPSSPWRSPLAGAGERADSASPAGSCRLLRASLSRQGVYGYSVAFGAPACSSHSKNRRTYDPTYVAFLTRQVAAGDSLPVRKQHLLGGRCAAQRLSGRISTTRHTSTSSTSSTTASCFGTRRTWTPPITNVNSRRSNTPPPQRLATRRRPMAPMAIGPSQRTPRRPTNRIPVMVTALPFIS